MFVYLESCLVFSLMLFLLALFGYGPPLMRTADSRIFSPPPRDNVKKRDLLFGDLIFNLFSVAELAFYAHNSD